MPNVVELLRQREALTAEARGLVDAAESRGEAPAEREAAGLEELRGQVEGLDGRIRAQATVDQLDRDAPGRSVTGDQRFDGELRSFRLTRLLASSFDPSVDAGRERELCQETARRAGRSTEGFLVPFGALAPSRPERRVLTAGSGGGAAALVQTEILGNEFIDALRPAAVVGSLGARMISGLRGDISLPKRSSRAPAPAWFAENAAITPADQAFTQVGGTPRHLGLITEYSRKTLLQTTPDIEMLVREHFIAELAVGLDAAALKGTGSPPVPRGITATTGIGEVVFSSAQRIWGDVVDCIATVEAANVPNSSLGWAMNSWVKSRMRTAYRFDPAIIGESVSDITNSFVLADLGGGLAGAPVAVSNQLLGDPLAETPVVGEAIFGAWNHLIIAMWSGVEILVNPYESTAYAKGNVSVRGILDADVLLTHPAAFCHYTGIDLVAPTPTPAPGE
jgi:HK97 family phage major capsid protein